MTKPSLDTFKKVYIPGRATDNPEKAGEVAWVVYNSKDPEPPSLISADTELPYNSFMISIDTGKTRREDEHHIKEHFDRHPDPEKSRDYHLGQNRKPGLIYITANDYTLGLIKSVLGEDATFDPSNKPENVVGLNQPTSPIKSLKRVALNPHSLSLNSIMGGLALQSVRNPTTTERQRADWGASGLLDNMMKALTADKLAQEMREQAIGHDCCRHHFEWEEDPTKNKVVYYALQQAEDQFARKPKVSETPDIISRG